MALRVEPAALALRPRTTLSQVLATFALILIINGRHPDGVRQRPAAVRPRRARRPRGAAARALLPAYRLVIIGAGWALALLLWLLLTKTRMGALVRAGASNREMGHRAWASTSSGSVHRRVRHRRGAVRRWPGVLMGASSSRLQVGHGREHPDPRLRRHRHRRHRLDPRRPGSCALLVGVVDTFGRTVLQALFREFLPPQMASAAGPGGGPRSRSHVFMAVVLAVDAAGPVPGERG
jgi:branched-chain amino acid transport system permease protein